MTTSVRRAAQQQLGRLFRRRAPPLSARIDLHPSSPSSSSCSLLGSGFSADGFSPYQRCAELPWTWAAVMAQQIRGVKISGSEAGRIEKVLKTQHTTQGRGGATIQVELRDVQSGLKSSARLRTSEGIEKVFVDERAYTYLYQEDETVYLMEPKTFEQVEMPKAYFDTGAAYLTDGMEVTVQYFDGKPLSASVPARVTCTIAEAEPYFKGQTATPSYKRAVLENGRQIMVPTFVSAGDVVVVDTTDDSYVTRSKE